MSVHRLTRITLGVPDVDAAAAFYGAFGLDEIAPGRFATTHGGEQLALVEAAPRRLVEVGVGVDEEADLDALAGAGELIESVDGKAVRIVDSASGHTVVATVAEPIVIDDVGAAPDPNTPGHLARSTRRSAVIDRSGVPAVRKLSHVVLGTPDLETTRRLFVDVLGFRVSDSIPGIGAFLRCSADHHSVFVQQAPVGFLHHTAWLVDDADEVGRAGAALVAADPDRHVWGLGRHYIGSNIFWYLRDPAGNFCEYTSDLDQIVDEDAWKPEEITDERAVYAWAPPLPPEFIAPPDLADLIQAGG